MIKNYNVVTKRTYEGADGVTKTIWMNVGRLTQFPANEQKPEGFRLELNMFPTTDFMIFPAEKKEQPKADVPTIEYPADEVNPNNIPF
jgi:hypothetical protein